MMKKGMELSPRMPINQRRINGIGILDCLEMKIPLDCEGEEDLKRADAHGRGMCVSCANFLPFFPWGENAILPRIWQGIFPYY
jgi:hypothetical protein